MSNARRKSREIERINTAIFQNFKWKSKCIPLESQLWFSHKIYTEKNSSRNFTQLCSKVETYEQVGKYLILLS